MFVTVEHKVIDKDAKEFADLTFELIINSQEKENKLAFNYGLTQAELRCLRYFNTDEIINNKAIADRMNLSPSRLTRIIDGLVKKRLVIRELNTEDRRYMKVSLSESGSSLLKQINESYLNIHKDILRSLNPAQHKQVINTLKNLVDSLEKWISKS